MKKLCILALLCFTSVNIFAQKKERLFWGVSTSVDFGRFHDRFEFTPLVGIKLFPKAYFGLGATLSYYASEMYEYDEKRGNITDSKYKDNVWYTGGELFFRYLPFKPKQSIIGNMYLQASYEILQGQGKYTQHNKDFSYDTANYTPFVGLGYKQALGERLNLAFSVSFKLNNEKDSPYRNPLIHIALEF